MKRIVILLLSTVSLQLSASGQGPLTPPGPPTPTMKTLAQIEARTPISSVPFTAAASGAYYLTSNLNAPSGNGITITAGNVSIDLNGFALIGNASSIGIYASNTASNVILKNGEITGWQLGIFAGANNYLLEDLVVTGCSAIGIDCNNNALVRNCISSFNVGNGILVFGGGQVLNCEASNNGGYGIEMISGIVRDCRVANNSTSGIYLNGNGNEAIGNVCLGNNTSLNTVQAGIYVNGQENRVENNHVTGSGAAGISVNIVFNFNTIIKNYVGGNGASNYIALGTQVIGPLISTTGTITNLNPWANFSY
jgi:hypothetical protein